MLDIYNMCINIWNLGRKEISNCRYIYWSKESIWHSQSWNSTQKVGKLQTDGTKSKKHKVICGVPQGSVIGPQIILDLWHNKCIKFIEIHIIADDKTILWSHAKIQELEKH